jgi:hypothetical protein
LPRASDPNDDGGALNNFKFNEIGELDHLSNPLSKEAMMHDAVFIYLFLLESIFVIFNFYDKLENKKIERHQMILADKSRMTQTQLEGVQRRKIQEGRLKRNLQEIAQYAIFIAILLVIAFSVVDSNTYKYKCAIATLFQLDSNWVQEVK